MTAEARTPRLSWWSVLTAAVSLLAGAASTGAVARSVFQDAVNQQIRQEVSQAISQHSRDGDAHAAVSKALALLEQNATADDTEKARLQRQLDELQRKVEMTHELVIELRADIRRGRR